MDLIERQAAIDALEDAEDAFGYLTKDWRVVLGQLPPAQLGTNLAEVGTDLISREAALNIAFKYCPDDDGTCSEAGADLRNMLDELENLPPAQPEIIYCGDCKYKRRWN